MNTTHTPGPWSAFWMETNKRHHTGHWTIFGGRFGMPIFGTQTVRTRQSEADAALAAAAPELLTALRSLVICINTDSDGEECEAAMIGASAAIAKAEGRAQ